MKLGVILSSVRQGRMTERLSKWVLKEANKLPDTKVEFIDLKDYPMPLFDESASPKYNQHRQPVPNAQKWLDILNVQDAYVIVTPEYNHGMPGALKNAIDYIDWQIAKKPFAVVSHGSTGGARATSDLKIVLSEARAFVISTNVAFTHRVGENFDDEGNLLEPMASQEHGPQTTLQNSLQELKWYSDALATARD